MLKHLHRCSCNYLVRWGLRYVGDASTSSISSKTINTISNCLKIKESEAHYMCLKHPTITKLKDQEIIEIVETVKELGYPKKVLVELPLLFSSLPITLKYRHQVLTECGFENITTKHLTSYLTLVKQKTVAELKKSKVIPAVLNIENRLASYMTQWPTSLTTLIVGDAEEKTLYQLRLKIIQRYLELVLDLTEEEFYRGVQTYATIKHRPLAVINESLTLLQSSLRIPKEKIKNNLYLIHTDPENLKHIIFEFRAIAGIDIKEIVKLHPKIAMKNFKTLFEMRRVLQNYNISDEAQAKCFPIYTLSPETVSERLEKAKEIPEFEVLFNHPRFLKMIYYNKTAIKRLQSLYSNNKKCLSLNVLSGCSDHYKLFEKAPGDRSGKGKDLIFCLSEAFGKKISASLIRRQIQRHQYWINVPVVQVKYVFKKLSTHFTDKEIYENCTILLYPWSKVNETIKLINANGKNNKSPLSNIIDNVDYSKLNKSQVLSLVLYLLERKHYFTGNGIWTEEQKQNIEFSYVEGTHNIKDSSA